MTEEKTGEKELIQKISGWDEKYIKMLQANRKISLVEEPSKEKPNLSLIETPESRGETFKSFKMESLTSNQNEVIDPSKKIQAWYSWRERNKDGIPGISKLNSDIILQYLYDMEKGLNTGKRSKKGKRSARRLGGLAFHIVKLAKFFEERYHKNIVITPGDPKSCLTREEVHELFEDLNSGTILQRNGKEYRSAPDFIRDFICFWNWYMRVIDEENEKVDGKNEEIETENIKIRKENKSRVKNKLKPLPEKPKLEKTFVPDLVKYLSRGDLMDSNSFVYFTYEDLKEILPALNEDEKTLALFLFDSIIRSPNEVANIYVNDLTFEENEVWVNVRKEISKTYERKFNLILSGELIKDHIQRNRLFPEDRLFPKYNPRTFNRHVQRAFIKKFGNCVSKSGKPLSEITGYSFRHSGCCYLRSKRINLDTLRVRGGWKTFKRIDYYTKFLGLDGRISKDMLNEEPSVNQSLMKLIEKQNDELSLMRQKLAELLAEKTASSIEVKQYA